MNSPFAKIAPGQPKISGKAASNRCPQAAGGWQPLTMIPVPEILFARMLCLAKAKPQENNMVTQRFFHALGAIFLLSILWVTIVYPALGSRQAGAPTEALTVRAGFYQNPPKIYTDSAGTITGFWPDLLTAIAAEEGWNIEWVPGTWNESLARLENGQIDVMPDVVWSEPRSQKYAFSTQKVLVSWTRLYARPGSHIETILDLEGKTIAGLGGSINMEGPEGIKDLTTRFGVHSTFVDMDTYTQVFEALEKGQIDAGITNKDFGNQHEGEYAVERTPFIFQPAHIEFAFPKNGELTPLLQERIDTHVATLKADPHSVYYQLLEKYLEQKAAATVIEIIPTWAQNLLLAGGGIILFLLAVGVVSQVQVRQRTADLQASEARNRALLNSIPDMMFRLDAQGTFLDYQAASEEMLYASPEQFLGKTVTDVMPPENAATALRLTRAALDSRQVQTHEYQLPIKEQLRDYEARYIPQRNREVLVIVRDITERKQAEEALRKSEARLKEAERLALLGHWELNLQNNTLHWSDQIYRIFEMDPAQFRASYEAFLDTVHPDDRDLVDKAYTESVKNRTPYSIDHRIVLKDGKIRFVHEQCETYYNEQGHATRSIGTVQDITERKQAEEALRQQEHFITAIVDTSPAIVYVYDMETQSNVFVNSGIERILGYSPQEIRAMGAELFARLIHPDDITAVLEFQQQILAAADEDTLEIKYRMRRKGGGWLVLHSYERPFLRNADGSVKQKIGVAIDITKRKQAEEERDAARQLFQKMFEFSPVATSLSSVSDRKLVDLNEAAATLLGYSRDELLGIYAPTINYWVNPEERQEVFETLVATGRVTNYEFTYQNRAGEIGQAIIFAEIFEQQGEQYILSAMVDITEQKRAEQALRESEIKFRSVVEQATDGISLADEQGVIIEWNRSMAELTGLPAAGVVGQYTWDVQAQLDPARFRRPEDVTALKQSLQNVLQTGQMPWAGQIMEREYTHPDGSQRYIQGSVFPIQTAKGFMLVSLSRDVTEHRQAQEALRQSEEQYRTLFEEAGDGIMVLDEQNNPLDANKRICTMLGYNRDELMATNAVALIHPEDLQTKDHAAALEALLQGHSVRSDYRLKRKDGSYIPTELNTKILGPNRFLNIIRDITERVQAQEALQRYNDRLTILSRIDRDIVAARSPEEIIGPVLTGIRRLIPCTRADVVLFEMDTSEMVIFSTDSSVDTVIDTGQRRPFVRNQRIEQLEAGQVIVTPDLRLLSPSPSPETINQLIKEGLRSSMSVPLIAQGQLIAALFLTDVTPNYFTAEHQEIAGEVANQLAIALHQNRLGQQVKSRVQELTAIHRAGQQLQHLQTPGSLAQTIIQVLEETLGYDYGAVLLTEPGSDRLLPFALSSQQQGPDFVARDKALVASYDIRVGKGITGWVAQTGQSVCVDDVRQDPRYFAVRGNKIRSELCVPIRAGEEIIGVVNIETTRPHAYSQADQRVLETVAAQISSAIQNSRLLERLEKYAEELEQRVAQRTAELDARNRELETFTYSVSHDLKAPLRGIDGYRRLLLEEHAAGLNDEGQTFLHTIHRAANQMGELIDDLLAYSRLERRPRQSEAVDLPALVNALLAEHSAEIQAGTVTVNVDISACATVTADPNGLMLALRNLLDNALKFSQKTPQPVIEVGGRKSQNGCIIWVRDNGIGFKMKFHDRIFDIFQRLHRLEEYPGTGIGLAIVSKAMERMGGRVWAESEPGRGATFYLEIPADNT
ncbi:MAG: PAS domain S-box protein [Chloroflexi bacterium]|nr:MAG: PAS domain S-box protein [Chloroflexota bacterium]